MSNQPLDQTIDILGQALKELVENKSKAGDLDSVTFLNFKAVKNETNYGKGIIFSGHGTSKQIVLSQNPDRFFISENIDLAQDASLMINRVKVIDSNELGPTIVKSSLRELGRLNNLIVDGSISLNSYLFFNSTTNRLGLGTETPNATISIVDGFTETLIGTNEYNHGFIGTYNTSDFDIIAGSKIWITIKPNGSIDLGNPKENSSKVRVNGKLAVGVSVPDNDVDLHVAGPVRLNNRLQIYSENPPGSGTYGLGDIVWNTTPRPGGNLGWVCTRAGSPGVWNRFGDIR